VILKSVVKHLPNLVMIMMLALMIIVTPKMDVIMNWYPVKITILVQLILAIVQLVVYILHMIALTWTLAHVSNVLIWLVVSIQISLSTILTSVP
jgi:hypothetical protein